MSTTSKVINPIVGANIKARMDARKLRRDELAKLSDVSYSMLTMTIQGIRMPRVEVLERIAKVLGCQVGDLFSKEVK